MDRGAALVQRLGRHDRHLLGRLQRAADRRPPAAGAEGGDLALLDRRPLRRRHPLHGRLPARSTSSPGARPCSPSTPRRPTRRWSATSGARCGWSGWKARLLARGMAPAPAPRRLLQAWLDLRGLFRHRSARSIWWAAGPTATRNADLPHARQHLQCPRKGLVGPWAHKYPHFALPGPQIGFLQECLRWWDKWLKGIETGIMDEPMLRVLDAGPGPALPPGMPKSRDAGRRKRAGPARVSDRQPGRSRRARLRRPGVSAGGRAAVHLLAADGRRGGGQMVRLWPRRGPARRSARRGGRVARLRYASVLEEPLEILGAPVLHLDVAADRPNAFVAVTLSEVLPDGAATRISYGVLNLTHRDGHEDLKPLEPGKPLQGAHPDERMRPADRRRQPAAAGDLHRLLADRLAVAGEGDALRHDGDELARAAGSSGRGRSAAADFGPPRTRPPIRTQAATAGRAQASRSARTCSPTGLTVERWQDDGLIHIEDFDWNWSHRGTAFLLDPVPTIRFPPKRTPTGRRNMRETTSASTSRPARR